MRPLPVSAFRAPARRCRGMSALGSCQSTIVRDEFAARYRSLAIHPFRRCGSALLAGRRTRRPVSVSIAYRPHPSDPPALPHRPGPTPPPAATPGTRTARHAAGDQRRDTRPTRPHGGPSAGRENPHPADVAPGLAGHQRGCAFAQPVRGLAYPFQAAFHGIAHQAIAGEGGAIHAGQVSFNPLGVLDDVGQAVGRVVSRRHADDLSRC
jgi:hypothetical protein